VVSNTGRDTVTVVKDDVIEIKTTVAWSIQDPDPALLDVKEKSDDVEPISTSPEIPDTETEVFWTFIRFIGP